MKQKRKVFLLLLILLLLCCACNNGDRVSVKSWGSSAPDFGARISAELLSEKTVGVQTPFEVMVGIGNCGVYSTGNLEIEAPGFEITNAEGTTYTDVYTCLYEGFDEETYGYHVENEEYLGLKYSECFQFKYVGEAESGDISFWIFASRDGEKPISGSALVSLFYSVEDGKITLAKEYPFKESSTLLEKVE